MFMGGASLSVSHVIGKRYLSAYVTTTGMIRLSWGFPRRIYFKYPCGSFYLNCSIPFQKLQTANECAISAVTSLCAASDEVED